MATAAVTKIRQMGRNGGVLTHVDENGETQFLYVDRPTAAYVLHGGQLDLPEFDVPEHERTGHLSHRFMVNAGFLPHVDIF